MYLTVLPIKIVHWCPYEEEGEGQKERQPVQTGLKIVKNIKVWVSFFMKKVQFENA